MVWLFAAAFLTCLFSHPGNAQNYTGYRIYLYNFHEHGDKEKAGLDLVCDIANTGRYDLDLSIADTSQCSVLIQFESDNSITDMDSLRDPIFCALVAQSFKLKKGSYIKDISIEVDPAEQDRFSCLSAPERRIEMEDESPVRKDDSDTLKADCYDLIFDKIELERITKRKAEIKYTISNVGTAPFRSGEPSELAVTFFLSGTEKMSKGAIPLGGAYLEPTESREIVIAPGSSFSGYLNIDIRKKTRYLNYLILKVDARNRYQECNDLNNTQSLFIITK